MFPQIIFSSSRNAQNTRIIRDMPRFNCDKKWGEFSDFCEYNLKNEMLFSWVFLISTRDFDRIKTFSINLRNWNLQTTRELKFVSTSQIVTRDPPLSPSPQNAWVWNRKKNINLYQSLSQKKKGLKAIFFLDFLFLYKAFCNQYSRRNLSKIFINYKNSYKKLS